VRHDPAVSDPVQALEGEGWLRAVEGPPPVTPVAESVAATLAGLDREVRARAAGALDLWSVAFFVLLALALRQVVKGHVLAPAATLLWYAIGAFVARGRAGPGDIAK